MEKTVMLMLAVIGLILTMPILGVLAGMCSGWVVGLFFTDIVIGFLSRIGVDTAGLAVWQVGGALGFLCGFLKTSIHQSKG